MPLRLGMPMSMTTTSGFRDFARETASRPSLASPTTVRSGCCSTSRRRPPRMSLWSSARRMRIFLMVGSWLVLGRIRVMERQFCFDRRAFSVSGFDREGATETPDTLFHAENAHAALAFGIEAVSGIGNFDGDFVSALNNGNLRA